MIKIGKKYRVISKIQREGCYTDREKEIFAEISKEESLLCCKIERCGCGLTTLEGEHFFVTFKQNKEYKKILIYEKDMNSFKEASVLEQEEMEL